KYRLVFRRSVAKDLRNIPRKDVARILKCFNALSEDPRAHGWEKISGEEKYRVRRGVCRIICGIKDDTLAVVVVRVGHRRHVYRGS
ncbi:MAG TPA: type II toxin-antitoxin system RelE/ParE family toxin, partial [Sumerlaeia bacterium]|nr:type II toxin-antitoxin system RelE/ParE family toxin [Sumerlaeia bacterium]